MDQAKKLLEFCEKYQALNFKEGCIKLLIEALTIKNCLELAILANRYQAPALQECAMDKIVEGGEKIMEGDYWQLIKSDFPDILEGVMKKLYCRFKNSYGQKKYCNYCGRY